VLYFGWGRGWGTGRLILGWCLKVGGLGWVAASRDFSANVIDDAALRAGVGGSSVSTHDGNSELAIVGEICHRRARLDSDVVVATKANELRYRWTQCSRVVGNR
jgi:hypothetical protein